MTFLGYWGASCYFQMDQTVKTAGCGSLTLTVIQSMALRHFTHSTVHPRFY